MHKIVDSVRGRLIMHPYLEYVNPELGNLLTQIGLDKQYLKGEGCYMYDQEGQAYLDFIAAYGALPFGFNHSEIWDTVQNVHKNMEPSFAQPSLLEAAGQLAKKLVQLAPEGLTKVTYANSGTEAVEAALKLAKARTNKSGILATFNSFHGKTLGALSATGNPSYQKAFFAPVEGYHFIEYGNAQALLSYLEQHANEVAAFIIEPIQGEGGIVEPPAGYLREVKEICTKHNVLLIFDEIQTGLGRTGQLFACNHEQVTPDIMTLAKALGGGLIPIGAVLCTDDVYTAEFAHKHSSTFAGNTLACRVGLKVMEILTRDDQHLIKEVARKGKILKQGLLAIQEKYPGIIKSIRGSGFMLGIDFGYERDKYPGSLLGVMAEQELLSPVIASYLLNVEHLRVAPTLNGASVIRIEPPLIVSEAEIQLALERIDRTVARLAQRNTAAFISHLFNINVIDQQEIKQPRANVYSWDNSHEGKFAFLLHPVNDQNYAQFDESLTVFSDAQLADLNGRCSDLFEPFVVGSTRITSQDGKTAFGDFISIPRTAKELQEMPSEQAQAEIMQAVDLAVSRGAKLVGLGAYTSVVTGGGRALLNKTDVALTTGNSFTVLSGVDALLNAAGRLGLATNELTAAVLGAGGAIGKATAILLAEKVAKLILIGNPNRPEKSQFRMLKVMAETYRYLSEQATLGVVYLPGTIGDYVTKLTDRPDVCDSLAVWTDYVSRELERGCPYVQTVDLGAHLPDADLILAATSSTDALITANNLKAGAVVCDMSRPENVSRDVMNKRPDVLVIDGGLIEVPGRPDLGWDFGFETGLAYACMSETMMLALEQRYENASLGADLNIAYMNELRDLASQQGFELAGLRSFDTPLTKCEWDHVVKQRTKVLV